MAGDPPPTLVRGGLAATDARFRDLAARLQLRTVQFWSLYNLLPLALAYAYRDLVSDPVAQVAALVIPAVEGTLLGYFGFVRLAQNDPGGKSDARTRA